MLVEDLVEKPEFNAAPSLLGIQGRYIFTSELFYHLDVQDQVQREIQLTDAMQL